jgi:lipoyl(octanoyl) transferase
LQVASSLPNGLHLEVHDLGLIAYQDALARQHEALARILRARDLRDHHPRDPHANLAGVIYLLEHPPTITISQRASAATNLLASPAQLAAQGVTIEPTDRGGDITYHGPGQLVIYPVLDLNALHLRLHDYMRLLEQAIIDCLAALAIPAHREAGATGVWVGQSADPASPPTRKIAALGVRLKQWISLHGLALNINPDMSHFNLIVPCGLVGRAVTSIAMERSDSGGPATVASIKPLMIAALNAQLQAHVGAHLQAHAREHAPPTQGDSPSLPSAD